MVRIANIGGKQAQELITDDAYALHDGLAEMVLAGEDVGRILAELADTLGVGVVLTSTDGRERAAALDDALRDRLASAHLVDETGRLRVERLGEPRALGKGEARLLPVRAPGNDLARMLAVSPRSPLTTADVRALERSATVVALWITRERAVSAVEHKYRGDFLRDVLLGRAGGGEFVLEHAADFGWVLARPMVVLSAQIDPQPPDEEPAGEQQRRQWQERFAAAWRQVVATVDPTSPTADFSSEVVAVLPAGGADADSVVRRVVHDVAGDKGGGRRSFSVGVSRVVDGVGGYPEAYAQARRAVDVGRRVHGHGSTTWFDQLGLHRLLAMVPDTSELEAFVTDVLGDLAGDTEEAATLRHTLQVLLDTNFNVAEASRTQFFHYNTMRYRVGKLERLLGPLGTDPNLRLDVAVALKALEVTGPRG
ncbi:PucR family transcriptional regulator [Nocardioides terrisoli]|uniref:PucR family transcriptional regulator n=1 Tax=Nocardioides terrisoli TaxID=3388267 RepID=UPI00287BC192|nr:helix-turn-helix domain-containing protein [Nocardioides marmorisolisilvae]